MIKKILQLGDPRLSQVSVSVGDAEFGALSGLISDLKDTLADFRAASGRGRAIAAPQIGILKRVLYLDTELRGPMVNPALTDLSPEMFEVWDDCLCFPELAVKVQRHRFCTVSYGDLNGGRHQLRLEGAMSELLQHECDHLDGILAITRARESRALKPPLGGER